MTCSNELRAAGKAYPRTCRRCVWGPCQKPVPSPSLKKEFP